MTTNQTIDGVPREALADFIEYSVPGPYEQREKWGADKAELRALLDAPAKCEMCDGSGRLGMGLCQCFDKPAAQPQGEPVANPVIAYAESYRAMLRQGVENVSIWSVITGLERNIAPLYAEQPAPVAVVLPERMSDQQIINNTHCSEGWNACLDEVTRLNTKE